MNDAWQAYDSIKNGTLWYRRCYL